MPGYGIFLGVWFVGDDGWLLATQCHPGDPRDDPMAEPGEPGHAPCADQQTLLHTADGGQSWSPLPDAPAATNGAILRIDELRAYSRVGCRSDCTGRGLYRTDDGAQTWTEVGALPLGDLDAASGLRIAGLDGWLAVNQLDPRTIPPSAATFTERLAHTGDGGHTWELIDVPRGWSRAFDLAGGVVVGSGGDTGISLYDPASRRWQPAATDAGPDLSRFMFVTPDVGYATDRDYALWATADGGATWSLRSGALSWNFAPDGVLWGYDKNIAIHLSDDGGRTTHELTHMPPATTPPTPGVVVAAIGDSVWLRRTDGLWRSDDGGATWWHVDVAPYAQYHFVDAWHGWTNMCGWQACEGAIRYTSDGGDTWELRPAPANAYVDGITFQNVVDGWTWGAGSQPGCPCLVVTHDGGASWQTLTTAPWSLSRAVWLDAGRAWGVAVPPSFAQPPAVVGTGDGGATWREEAALDRAVFETQFAARDERVWLFASTTRWSGTSGPYDPPRRVLIYRRDAPPPSTRVPSTSVDQ